MPPAKKPRTCSTNFDPDDLLQLWKPLAELKDAGFSWMGNDYDKSKRTQGPDREGLQTYAVALEKLMQVVNGGIPRHTPIKLTLAALHDKYGIA